LKEVEQKVASLLEYQEEEAAKMLSNAAPKRGSNRGMSRQAPSSEDWPRIIQTNCSLLKALQESVTRLELSNSNRVSNHPASASSADINKVCEYMQKHMQDNYYTRKEMDTLLGKVELKTTRGITEEMKSASRYQGSGTSTPYGRGGQLQGVEARLERSEARFDKSLVDLSDRLDPLQDFVEQQKLASWQAARHLPEVSQKLDQLWAQCQHNFAKIKEHDVHFKFFRNSFESHKQQCLDMDDGFEHSNRKSSEDMLLHSSWAAGSQEEGGCIAASKAMESVTVQ